MSESELAERLDRIEDQMTIRTHDENLDRIRAALDAVVTVEMVPNLAERRHALLRSILSRPWPVDSFGEITSQSFQQMDRELIAVGLRIARDEFGRPRYDRDNNRLTIEEVEVS